MISRQTKLRFRRKIRFHKRQAKEIGSVAEDSLNKYIFKRLLRLVNVRRFVFGWIGLIIVASIGIVLQTRSLSAHYLELAPVSGGTFREGMVGAFTNANPLYAQSEVDTSASRLLFSGLFKFDKTGKLVPDLAEKYELDASETLYTVHLKSNLKWDDGMPITSKDVVFTYTTIQNPEAKSYLISSWRGITVTAVDKKTVTFKLTNSLSAFPESLVTGIIPEHILSSTSPSQLRSDAFNNQKPIGSGPFAFQAVEIDDMTKGGSTRIAFKNNGLYHDGAPQLERFIIRTYKNDDQLTQAFKKNEIDAIVGLDQVPDSIQKMNISTYGIPLTNQVMVFFRTSQEILKDANIRKALVLGINKQDVFNTLPNPVINIDEPILHGQLGYNKSYAQITNNKQEANNILDNAGWKKDPATNIRTKDGQQLKFRLNSSTNSEFTSISGELQKQWRDLGVEVEVVLQGDEELQSSVSTHNYDALMYGISVGLDPDVYAYWHGSQGDVRSETRLNLSEYKSAVADKALEAGRTRSDKQNRAVKYRPFLEAWRNDSPALALYQSQFLYITTDQLSGFEYPLAHTSTDRYVNVNQWKIRKAPQRIQE